jgi:hypothetical protein
MTDTPAVGLHASVRIVERIGANPVRFRRRRLECRTAFPASTRRRSDRERNRSPPGPACRGERGQRPRRRAGHRCRSIRSRVYAPRRGGWIVTMGVRFRSPRRGGWIVTMGVRFRSRFRSGSDLRGSDLRSQPAVSWLLARVRHCGRTRRRRPRGGRGSRPWGRGPDPAVPSRAGPGCGSPGRIPQKRCRMRCSGSRPDLLSKAILRHGRAARR